MIRYNCVSGPSDVAHRFPVCVGVYIFVIECKYVCWAPCAHVVGRCMCTIEFICCELPVAREGPYATPVPTTTHRCRGKQLHLFRIPRSPARICRRVLTSHQRSETMTHISPDDLPRVGTMQSLVATIHFRETCHHESRRR